MGKIYRFIRYLILLFILGNGMPAERLAVLKENFAAPFMVFSKEYIYIGDKGTFAINIYDRKSFSFLKKFGGKGEGPGQFMWIHSIHADQDILYVSSPTKIAIFSKEGILKKEIRLDPNSGNHLPFGRKFVSQTYLDGKTPGENYQIINLIGENGKKIKELYSTPITTIWTFKEPKNDCRLIVDCVAYNVYDRKLYLGNSMKGFYFIIFNENGEKILKKVVLPLPLDAVFYISDRKFYYLTDNENIEMWELHSIKIAN